MSKNLITTIAVALFMGVTLTACSAPEAEQPAPAPAPVEEVEEEQTVAPAEEFVEFGETEESTYDGVPVKCEADEEGSNATSARITPTDAEHPSAVQGDTTHFVVECAYPVTDEIMSVIEEIQNSEE